MHALHKLVVSAALFLVFHNTWAASSTSRTLPTFPSTTATTTIPSSGRAPTSSSTTNQTSTSTLPSEGIIQLQQKPAMYKSMSTTTTNTFPANAPTKAPNPGSDGNPGAEYYNGSDATQLPGYNSLLNAPIPPPPTEDASSTNNDKEDYEPGEILVVSQNMSAATRLANQAQRLGLSVRRRSKLNGLGFVITIFHVTGQTPVGRGLVKLRKLIPSVWADVNTRYHLLGDEAKTYGSGLIGWKASGNCGRQIRIGVIDTAIDVNHPLLAGRHILTHNIVTTGINSAAANHGTEIASLLVGRNIGLMPAAHLYAASVFRSQSGHVDTTAEWIVRGLDWLARNKTSVINLSLGGSRNLIIELALKRLIDHGVTIVAAAGNSGPDAPPVYPAAQPGVIAVTAIDRNLKPYQFANHGDYIAFAAPGVDVWAAAPGKSGLFVSGTSYAAPFVTAAIAANNGWPRAKFLKHLQVTARDLGKKGKDPVFGWGLLQYAGCKSSRHNAMN